MTVTAENPITVYAPTGAALGPYATVWTYADAADVAVIIETNGVEGAPLALGSTYTLVGSPASGGGYTGQVTLDPGGLPADGFVAGRDRLILMRATAVTQTKPFGQVDGFRPPVAETAWDRTARISQEVGARAGRGILIPAGEEIMRLPRPSVRAGKAFFFDLDGKPYFPDVAYPPPLPTLPEINVLDYGMKGDGTDESDRLNDLLQSGKACKMPYTAAGYGLVNIEIPSNAQLLGDWRKTKIVHLEGGPLFKPRGSNWGVRNFRSYHDGADDPRVYEIDTPSVRREWQIYGHHTVDAGHWLDVLDGPSAVEVFALDDVIAYRQRGRFIANRRHFAGGWIGYEAKVIVSYTDSLDPNHEVVFVDGAIDLGGAGGLIYGEMDIQGSGSFPESATTPNQNGFHHRNTSGIYMGRVVADGVSADGWIWENCSYMFGAPETSISGGHGMVFYGDCAYVQFDNVKLIGRRSAAAYKPAGKNAVKVMAGATLRHATISGQMDDFTGEQISVDGALRGAVITPTIRTARELGGNLLVNGARQVWQRGLSRTLGTSLAYVCDCAVAQVGTGAAGTAAQVQFSAGDGLNGLTHVYRYTQTGTSSTQATLWAERIEGLGRAEAGTITLMDSARLVSGAAATLTPYVLQNFGSGGSPNVTTFGTPITISSTDFVDPVREIEVPSTVGKTIGAGAFTEIGWLLSAGAAKVVDLIAAQAVDGIGVPALAIRPFGTVRRDCLRYYRTSVPYGTTPAQNCGIAGAVAWAQIGAAAGHNIVPIRFDDEMAFTPTITLLNPSAANAQARNSDAGADCANSQPLTGVTARSGFAIYTEAAAGSAAGNANLLHYSAEASL